ncbi:uroporphyrinogen-III C-methyltransferase [Roseobacteraceae bacterium S113]
MSSQGTVALVGAGPGAKDLITLRGAQRMAAADVILYDRLLEPELLDLAGAQARCIYVGKAPGHHSWSQEEICAALVHHAMAGRCVVRLKCGDPGIFARSSEECAALREAGISVEVVPGVTAACAAAAAVGESLTERGAVTSVVLTTGHLREGEVVPEAVRALAPGACVALYMSVRAAGRIAAHIEAHFPGAPIEVSVVAHAQRARQRQLICAVADLASTLATAGITDTAMVFLRWPRLAGDAALSMAAE